MDERVFFHLCDETMLGDTKDFINAYLERTNRGDCNDADTEEVADRGHLHLTEMLLRAPTAEQHLWQQ